MSRAFIFNLIWIIGFLLSSGPLSAQTTYEDVILLKSAEVLRGTITDSVPGEQVTILLNDSLSRTVSYVDISRILKEPKRISKAEMETVRESKERRLDNAVYYQGIVSGGYGSGYEEDRLSFFKLNMIHGVGFHRRASFGPGAGLRILLEEDITVVPVFFDVRFAILSGDISPVLVFGVGNTFQKVNTMQDAGSIVYGEIGIRLLGQGKGGLMLTLGYENFGVILAPPGSFNPYNYSSQRRFKQISSITLNFAFVF